MIYYIDVAVRIITVNIICLVRSDDGDVIFDALERFDCSSESFTYLVITQLSNYMYFKHFTLIL